MKKFAAALFLAVMVQGSKTKDEVIIYSLENDSGEFNLLSTIEDLPRFFEAARQDQSLDFPSSFAFPRSFTYELTFGLVTYESKRRERIFEGSQKSIYDAENNRVRIERENRIFKETDTVVKLYDFDKMRLLVSDPIKKICMKQTLTDISPVSMVPRDNDQIVIMDAI